MFPFAIVVNNTKIVKDYFQATHKRWDSFPMKGEGSYMSEFHAGSKKIVLFHLCWPKWYYRPVCFAALSFLILFVTSWSIFSVFGFIILSLEYTPLWMYPMIHLALRKHGYKGDIEGVEGGHFVHKLREFLERGL